jgi:sulfur-carrier protein adenylyltransferase/sulfurtransferase
MKEKTVSELKQMRDDSVDFQLIDVREEHEFDMCNLEGDLIPLGNLLTDIEKIRKDVPVIVHCRSGSRSAAAINELEKRFGYENLYNLKGGIMAYSKEIDSSIIVS